MIDHSEDDVVLVDIGVADGVEPRVVSLARQEVPGGAPRAPVIV